MTKLSRKLFLSVLTVVLTFIALGTTTFAWFTLGGTVTASGVEAQIKAAEGIEVSTDGTTWTNTISLAQPGLTLTDVTSADGLTFYASAGDSTVTAAGNVFTSTFYVRATTATAVNLTSLVGVTQRTNNTPMDVTFSGYANTTATTPTNFTAGTSYNFDPVNALRFSFSTGTGTTATVKSKYEIAGIGNNGTAFITSANGSSIAHAYARAKDYTINTTIVPFTDATVITSLTASIGTGNSVLETGDFTSTITVNGNIVGNGDNYVYASVTINLWLEGWDADCLNAISGLTGINFGFALSASFN